MILHLDPRLEPKLMERTSVWSDVTLERFLMEDPVARRLAAHANRALAERNAPACRLALDKLAEWFYEEQQRPALTALIDELASA